MIRTTASARFVAFGTVAMLAAAMSACAGSAASPSDRVATTPAATVASTPMPTATPNPTPPLTADEALHAYLADQRLSLQGTYTASYRSGSVAGDLSGTYVARGDDFSISTTNAVPGWVKRVDQLLVGGDGYQREDEGRWYATDNVYLSSGLTSIIDDASWDEGSRSGWFAPEGIDLLALASAVGALPANLTIEGTEHVEGEVLAEIQPTGELTAMEIALAITSTLPGVGEQQSEWSFTFTFEPGSTPARIQAPAEVWRQELLTEALALVDLPSTFERHDDEGAEDLYFGPNAEGLYVTVGPANGMTPEQNYAQLVTFFTVDPENGWGGPPELDEELSVGGAVTVLDVVSDGEAAPREPTLGRLIAAHSMLDEETEIYLAKAIVQLGDKVYVLHWLGLADGTEADQLALFKEIASTFIPLA